LHRIDIKTITKSDEAIDRFHEIMESLTSPTNSMAAEHKDKIKQMIAFIL
jgi:hypothetical protein